MRNQHFEVALEALVAHWLEIQLGGKGKIAPKSDKEPPSSILSSGPLIQEV